MSAPVGARLAPEPRILRVYLLLRLILALALLMLPVFRQEQGLGGIHGGDLAVHAVPFVALMVLALAIGGRWGPSAWFTFLNQLLDIAFVSLVVVANGPPANPWFQLYFIGVLGSVWLGPPWLAVANGGVSALSFYLISASSEGWLDSLVNASILMRLFGLILVGVLATLLSSQLRATRGRFVAEQQARLQLETRHELLLDQLRTGILTVGSDGLINSANPAALELLGPVVGLALAEVLQLRGERWEQVVLQDGGDPRKVLCSRSQQPAGGEVVMMEDITRLRIMEEAVAREERLAAVGRLAAGLAHEIRNPLASLSGSVQLLEGEQKSPLHGIILREVHRINGLVEDLLDASRPMTLKAGEVRIPAVMDEVRIAFGNDPRFRSTVKVEVEARGECVAMLDEGRIRQVLWNLLLNAAQGMGRGGHVRMAAEEIDGDRVLLVVEDDGPGIEPDRLHRVFDPFYTTRVGGTGLGLATVERIVKAHMGSILVRSHPTQGARFEIRLPTLAPWCNPTGRVQEPRE